MNEEQNADKLNISENTFAYKSKGNYINYLNEYLQYFNRENCLIVKSEDLFSNTKNELMRIYQFLDVNYNFTPSISMDHKINESAKDIDIIPNDILEYLSSYFEESNIKLMKQFNINFLN